MRSCRPVICNCIRSPEKKGMHCHCMESYIVIYIYICVCVYILQSFKPFEPFKPFKVCSTVRAELMLIYARSVVLLNYAWCFIQETSFEGKGCVGWSVRTGIYVIYFILYPVHRLIELLTLCIAKSLSFDGRSRHAGGGARGVANDHPKLQHSMFPPFDIIQQKNRKHENMKTWKHRNLKPETRKPKPHEKSEKHK